MKPYLITGPESLLKAAHEEIAASGVIAIIDHTGGGPYKTLFISSQGHAWLSISPAYVDGRKEPLALPADWDKLMAILAELKKPKLPEHVRGLWAKYKVIGIHPRHAHLYQGYNIMGKSVDLLINDCTPITEQEFIDGGLKELAEAGYVKGARVKYDDGREYIVQTMEYQHPSINPQSGASYAEYVAKGFCFSLCDGRHHRLPVGRCTLVPAQPTTSQGIPYTLKNGNAVVYGNAGELVSLQCSTLRHLLRQGVTELVTKAGRLTQADLELLTK